MGEREPTKGTCGRAELPQELREVLQGFGHGCLAVETDISVVHICHAADTGIQNFADKPVRYQCQLVKLPTAPLIRLEVVILDRPANPYQFESFLNVASKDQARVLDQLANQDQLYPAFYSDGLNYCQDQLGTPTVTRTRIAYPSPVWFSIWKHGAGWRATLLQLLICDVCIAQACPTQVGVDQSCPVKVRFSQVGAAQVGPEQIGRGQIGRDQVRPSQVSRCQLYFALLRLRPAKSRLPTR